MTDSADKVVSLDADERRMRETLQGLLDNLPERLLIAVMRADDNLSFYKLARTNPRMTTASDVGAATLLQMQVLEFFYSSTEWTDE
ncbi:MAG: hypothetical protein ABIF82_09535 [Planctomycetota bacterium]